MLQEEALHDIIESRWWRYLSEFLYNDTSYQNVDPTEHVLEPKTFQLLKKMYL